MGAVRRVVAFLVGAAALGAALPHWRLGAAPPAVLPTVSLGAVMGNAGPPNPAFQVMLLQGFADTVPPRGRRSEGPARAPHRPVRALFGRFEATAWAADAGGIEHQKVGCVVAGQHPRIDACFPGTEVGRAQVFFRGADTGPWYTVDMAGEGTCLSATLPRPLPTLAQFQYYVDVVARDFRERTEPETAPDRAHRARVVAKEGDCDAGLRTALAVARAAAPIVVGGLAKGAAPAGFDAAGTVPASQAAPVSVSLVATGATSGAVMQLQALNEGGTPVRLFSGEALVVRPVSKGTPVAARAKAGLHTRSLTGFCLDFAKPPPPPGTVYELATGDAQRQFRPLARLLRAGRAMEQAGAFHPDSDPAAYADSIRQWSLWTHLSGWSAEQFADAFVKRTRENVEQVKKQWTPEMEAAVRAASTGRWKDIQEMLARASRD
jgi:hypothetical protein